MNSAHQLRLSLRRAAAVAFAAGVLLTPLTVLAQGSQGVDQEAALAAVRNEIKALESRVARQATQRNDSAKALRDLELTMAASARKLEKIRGDLRAQQARQLALGQEQRAAAAKLAGERHALGAQVRASYMTGREEIFKLVLSQEDPADLGRMLVYYDYFNRARSARIGAVNTKLETLRALATQIEAVQVELAALAAAQASEVAALSRSRDERRALLASLDSGLAAAASQIERLRSEERRLADLVKELGEILAEIPAGSQQPFARLKGRLPWPLQGKLAGDYGKLRDGGPMRWNGVLLEAGAGTAVRSIYHGRIAFADWLQGLGLLIIVDHGGGYMSLYGHNEALLKEAGDWVEPGESIAQVGDTGGRTRPALYFEIRHNGEPVNPHQWIAKAGSR
jgi:septal ring factor EnvC (AmiA/AmiB activator)